MRSAWISSLQGQPGQLSCAQEVLMAGLRIGSEASMVAKVVWNTLQPPWSTGSVTTRRCARLETAMP